MPFKTGPAPIRRTLQYLAQGNFKLKDRVSIVEIHVNMYFRYHRHEKQYSMNFQEPKIEDPESQAMAVDAEYKKLVGKENRKYDRKPDNHTGMREFYFWEVPKLQYQNPKVQMVRFLEKSPLPFLRVWLNDGTDVLFDGDNRDRTQILKQLIRTLGTETSEEDAEALKKTQTRSTNPLPMTDPVAGNPATFGYSRSRYCMCEVPDQVPCPGVIPLPMYLRAKYYKWHPEELETWENDLDRPYPTGKELEKISHAFPNRLVPYITDVKGLDQMFMRKPKQTTRPFTEPEKIAKQYDFNRLNDYPDRDTKLFEDHK